MLLAATSWHELYSLVVIEDMVLCGRFSLHDDTLSLTL